MIVDRMELGAHEQQRESGIINGCIITSFTMHFVLLCSVASLTDHTLFQMFRKLHNAYVDMICCPFYNPGDQIKSK